MGDFGPPVPVPETEVTGPALPSLIDADEVSVLVTGFGVSSICSMLGLESFDRLGFRFGLHANNVLAIQNQHSQCLVFDCLVSATVA